MHKFDPEKIYRQMIEVANNDGIITSDEKALIENVRQNITQYYQILIESYEDEVITAEEQNTLHESRKKIMTEAINIAKEDEAISQDEFALLRVIRDNLDEMELHEHY